MVHYRRFAGAVVVAGLAAGALTACDPVGTKFSDDSTVSEKITAVKLDNSSGDVTVHGKPGAGNAAVHRAITYRSGKPDATTRVEGGVLVLGGCGRNCSVDYTVELPAGLPISGGTSAGGINLSQVGEVSVHTDSGDITVDQASGSVDVRTNNGEIKGTSLKGDRIQAKTDNGGIKLTPGKAQDIKAKTSNGEIHVTVPAGSYRVSAGTDIGEKHIGVQNDPNGKYKLDLGTDIGDITVKTG
ncbi:DUF4097 family beta strand repeat-containing protein [Streptomyces sp. FH025]|uniref:DUF4097 family beta strand repeat-containing protein n=1 Tax=Streptomyces sp. FH025 TaxID=2815937 RepID=UPI001A9EDC14|nr:DUF4097 family beta strand repeat-containing protein [Streptomyces sp. FH025]MBO1419704.1 DUF4097 family beta strand repeat protein [Streptomyces sp. FH025]